MNSRCGSPRWVMLWLAGAASAVAAGGAATIMPDHGRIDDIEARLTYARILSYRRETWPEAVAAYERALRDYPNHAAALSELAEMRVRQGDLGAAEQQLRAALAIRPGEPGAVAALAQLLLWTARTADALDLLAAVSGLRPLNAEEKILEARTLSRVGRNADANRGFEELLAQQPNPPAEWLSAAADARLAAGEVMAARELYKRALAVNAKLGGAQRGYALTLAWTGEDAAARPQLEEALARQPDDGDVIHAYVRTLDRLDGAAVAIARARERAEAEPRNPRWRAEWAELEAQRGHAVRSRQLFAETLALGATPELELRAGRAAITWGDFHGAERALREALRRNPADLRAREELGQLLVSGDRVEEAEQFYERWLAEKAPADPALLGFARLRIKEKNFAAALIRCEALLQLRPDLPEALELKASVLLATHRPREAADIYARLAALPAHRVTAEIGLGRATLGFSPAAAAPHFTAALAADPVRPAARFYAAGREAARQEDFLRAVTGGAETAYTAGSRSVPAGPAAPQSAPQLVEWAGLFAEHGDFGRAVRCLRAARVADPDYYPAWAQLAQFLAIDGQFDAALREFAELRKVMPGNRQVLLGEARALAWSRRYEDALQTYAQLVALNPADPVPGREAARAAGWGKMRERGAQMYATAWLGKPVDGALADSLRRLLDGVSGAGLIETWRQWAEHPAPGAEPFGRTERFAEERFALREALPENRRARLDEIYLDVLPGLRVQRAWWVENAAKQYAWDRRYASAEQALRRLLIVEPGNEEALFDLSQAEAAQGLGQRERATLTQLIELDANHSLATQAIRRRQIRSRPVAAVEARSWREEGRGDLASLQRTVLTGELEDVIADQFTVRLGGQIGREAPLARDGRYAFRGVSLETSGVINPWLSGSAGMTHREFYDPRIGHADTGQAQLWLKRDAYSVGAGYEKREELTNEFALFQGVRSDNFWLGGVASWTRRWEAEARFTSTEFSDGNRGFSILARPAHAWTDHPRILKTIVTLEYRDTRRESIYLQAGGKLANIIFPYWTPRDYTHGAVTLEWYHDLAKEFFVGSQEHAYDLRLTFGVDSESNPATTFEADWHREWNDRWLARAGLYFNFSREWDAQGLRLRLARRF